MAKKREIFMCASLFCPVVVHCSLDADEDQRHHCPLSPLLRIPLLAWARREKERERDAALDLWPLWLMRWGRPALAVVY